MNIGLFAMLDYIKGKYVLRLVYRKMLSLKYVYTEMDFPAHKIECGNVEELERMIVIVVKDILKTQRAFKWKEYNINKISYERTIAFNRDCTKIVFSNINESSMIGLLVEKEPNSSYVNLNALRAETILVDPEFTVNDLGNITINAKIYSENGTRYGTISNKYFVPENYRQHDKKYLLDIVNNWFIGDLRYHKLKNLVVSETEMKKDVCKVGKHAFFIEL